MTVTVDPTPAAYAACRDEDGLSLVDLMTGMVIAIVLVASALTGVAQHQAQRRTHGELILAMSACRNKLESLRTVDIASLPGHNGEGFDVPGQNGQTHGLNTLPGDADGLVGQVEIEEQLPESTSLSRLYKVTVRVRWQGATRGGDFAMQTLMGERR